MDERRQQSRQRVTWPARLWLTDSCFLGGHAVNASLHGAWVHLNWLQSKLLTPGETYRLDLWPERTDELVSLAVVRHVDRYGAGLEILGGLPVPENVTDPPQRLQVVVANRLDSRE
jgi:hypothetical protein